MALVLWPSLQYVSECVWDGRHQDFWLPAYASFFIICSRGDLLCRCKFCLTKSPSIRASRYHPKTLFSTQATRPPSFVLSSPHSIPPCFTNSSFLLLPQHMCLPSTMLQPSSTICPGWWFQILLEGLQLRSGWTCTSEQQLTAFRSKKQQRRQLQYFSLFSFLSLPPPNPLPAQAWFSLWNNLAPGNCWILRLRAQQQLPCFPML